MTISNAIEAGRRAYVGSSEVAAIFGLDPRISPFELWHRKAGNIPEPPLDHEWLWWGTEMEPVIAKGVARKTGWQVRKVGRRIVHPSVPGLASTPDYEVIAHERGAGVLELKNMDRLVYRNLPDGEPPITYQLQLQHQLACTGRSWGAIAVLVGGNQLEVFEYPRHDAAIAKIEQKVAEFWRSVEAGEAPEPNFDLDLSALKALYQKADKGSVEDRSDDEHLAALCESHEAAGAIKREQEKEQERIKAEILSLIEDTETVLTRGWRILAKTVEETEISYTRKAYRNFRIYPLKSANEETIE